LWSDTVPPLNPGIGEKWLDTTNGKHVIKEYDGTEWKKVTALIDSENIDRESLGNLWHDKDSEFSTFPFIQTGYQLISRNGTSVSFTYAYTEPPRILISSNNQDKNAAITSVSTTGFSARVLSVTATGGDAYCYWLAIGRKE
jgi:hypothetical protein